MITLEGLLILAFGLGFIFGVLTTEIKWLNREVKRLSYRRIFSSEVKKK